MPALDVLATNPPKIFVPPIHCIVTQLIVNITIHWQIGLFPVGLVGGVLVGKTVDQVDELVKPKGRIL